MAIRAYIHTVVSSIQAAETRQGRTRTFSSGTAEKNSAASSSSATKRALLFSSLVAAVSQVDSKTELLQRYLEKSKENKAKNDKERLDSYNKRNYKDYFGFSEGSLRAKKGPLTETEKGILEWLEANK